VRAVHSTMSQFDRIMSILCPRRQVRLAHSPRYFAVKAPMGDSRYDPCNQSDTREWE
jgi:hypothetical protein